MVKDCEMSKQSLHQLDFFEVSLVLVVVVVNQFFKRKQMSIIKLTQLDFNKIELPISTGLKQLKFILKIEALIPIKLSRPDPEGSTRGNRRVPLSGSQFPERPSKDSQGIWHPNPTVNNDTLPCLTST